MKAKEKKQMISLYITAVVFLCNTTRGLIHKDTPTLAEE